MIKQLKKFHVVIFSTFIFLIHLPFVFAKSLPREISSPVPLAEITSEAGAISIVNSLNTNYGQVYENLNLGDLGLSKGAFENAVKGFNLLAKFGKLSNENILTIVDFSLPSNKKRLFVLDMSNSKLLYHTYVSHGRNSGKLYATDFSNAPESYKSSLGFYITKGTYSGKHGYSLKLEGEEKGYNDNASSRAIVMHSADYAAENVVKSQGYLGRSLGCPALPPSVYKPIIEQIKNGTCLFLYSPDEQYLKSSGLLRAS
ncbi:murein L,D-transpeptidase catalytic domain family protein [soil metagenome]